MASALGIDPIELRRRNALDVGKRTATDQLLTESVGLLKTIDAAERASGWNAAAAQGATASAGNAPTMRRGIGAASIYYGVSLGAKGLPLDGSGAHMNIYQDGSVRIAIGGSEMGQGLHTVLAQIAADALGASVASIRVDHVDTSIVPDSGPSVASRTTLMTGNAVLDAAGKLRERIARVAADMLECDPASLEFSGGRISSGSASVEFADVARECWARNVNTAAEGWYAAPETTFDENGLGNAYAVYSFATHVAEVEVDTETGQIHLLRVTAAHDVGRILNPVTLEGQIEGGVLQGAGMALYERMKTTAGRIDTPDFSTYILPTSVDVPEIRTIFVEEPYSAGPFGAKGIGETPLMPCPAAIANAVANALGMRFDELPITPEDVMRVLAEGESARCDS